LEANLGFPRNAYISAAEIHTDGRQDFYASECMIAEYLLREDRSNAIFVSTASLVSSLTFPCRDPTPNDP